MRGGLHDPPRGGVRYHQVTLCLQHQHRHSYAREGRAFIDGQEGFDSMTNDGL